MKKVILICLVLCIGILSSCDKPAEEAKYQEITFDDGAKYRGYVLDGKMNGQGKYTFSNGDYIEGTFENDLPLDATRYWNRTQGIVNFKGKFTDINTIDTSVKGIGKYSYPDGAYYEGEMLLQADYQSAIFDGKGIFQWANGGWRYEGDFKNGTIIKCVGTVDFNNPSYGIKWFTGEMSGFPAIKIGQTGYGEISFTDNSYYIGDIYYDGREWHRKGNGTMYFENCNFSASNAGGPSDSKLYRFSGAFDATVTGWMYGNGIAYFVDTAGNPSGYVSGNWSGLIRTGAYNTSNTIPELDEKWSAISESVYNRFRGRVEHYQNLYASKTTTNTLYLGDSYCEMWRVEYGLSNYELQMQSYDTINVGIGGTVAADWLNWCEQLVAPFTPENIVIHLGINDINALGYTSEECARDLQQLIELVHTTKPNANIYYISIEPSILFFHNWSRAKGSNEIMKTYCDTLDYLTYVDTASSFINDNTLVTSYYCSDNLHLSAQGYQVWSDIINKAVGLY